MVKEVAGLTFESVPVGHNEAITLLGSNTRNRKLRANRVNTYALDMLKGNWLTTGDTIKLSKDGALLDGQHRLAALIQACTEGARDADGTELAPQPRLKLSLVVVRGLDDDAQEAVDTGAARSLADILELNRMEKNASYLATALRVIYAWTAGARKTIAKRNQATNQTYLSFFDENPDTFRELVTRVHAEYQPGDRLVPPSILMLTHYLFEELGDPGDTEHFFARLQDGQDLHEGDPIYELRKALKKRLDERTHRTIAVILALVIKAWNAYRLGETLDGPLTYKMGGKHPEAFPEPL